jgi:xanthine dehydrogenase YagR molybdenum-binding subunit
VYLGVRAIVTRSSPASADAAPALSLAQMFRRGFVVNILNPKTARSQVLGAIVGGIGTALEEESVIDHAFGRFMTHNLADYHVPVNADVHDIEVIFIEEKDDANPLGVKGLGEIGIVSVAAAIANAVFHATGKRIRDLPITLDKLL